MVHSTKCSKTTYLTHNLAQSLQRIFSELSDPVHLRPFCFYHEGLLTLTRYNHTCMLAGQSLCKETVTKRYFGKSPPSQVAVGRCLWQSGMFLKGCFWEGSHWSDRVMEHSVWNVYIVKYKMSCCWTLNSSFTFCLYHSILYYFTWVAIKLSYGVEQYLPIN